MIPASSLSLIREYLSSGWDHHGTRHRSKSFTRATRENAEEPGGRYLWIAKVNKNFPCSNHSQEICCFVIFVTFPFQGLSLSFILNSVGVAHES